MEQELNTPEFDSFLGGTERLPSGVNLSEFMKQRMEEVVMLTETIKESPFRGQTFQRLPKHMRRRQMSHYIKRLPRRLQRAFLMSLKEGMPAPTKCPSRKYRRRPGNLLLEYNRRQKKSVWLETHIWHAKRFHMTAKWGYKLPEKPVNKSFKACYRAISEHCLLTDISYYNCIELMGSETELLEGLKQCNNSNCGLTFGAKMYLTGLREGSATLFHPNSYPYRVIGNIKFLWEPVSSIIEKRRIWIWIHPLLHDETVKCFISLFDLIKLEQKSMEIEEAVPKADVKKLDRKTKKKGDKKSKKAIEQIKLEPKNVPFTRTPKYINRNESVIMTLLKDTLNRFQLTGPLSQAIVSQVFAVAEVSLEESSEVEFLGVECKRRKKDAVEIVEEVKEVQTFDVKEKSWWEEYYRDRTNREVWEEQKMFYRQLSDCCKPTDLPAGIVLSVVVADPRLKIPPKRQKAVSEVKEGRQVPDDSVNSKLSRSPIWEPRIRDEVSLTKLTTEEINRARSKKIVPGFDVGDAIPDEKQSRIPILLVQRPGRRESGSGKLGLGSGWDIISPAGFGMPIWLSLIFRGARTGGLRESELLEFECKSLDGYLQPDSTSGECESQEKKLKLMDCYFKLPPNKRANYIKLGVVSPFCCPWRMLVRDWVSKTGGLEEQKFYVLRDQKILKELKETLVRITKRQVGVSKYLQIGSDSLVPVLIEFSGKGKPQDFAMICIPKNEDLNNSSNPVEPSHIDDNEKLRKQLRTEHLQMLLSLRRKRKKDRAKLKERLAEDSESKLKWTEVVKCNSAPSDASSSEYKLKMQSLWLPEVESVVNSCSRRVFGFVVKGDFSLSKSMGVALGYVTLPGLVEVVRHCTENKSKAVVLVRNRNNARYRFGKIMIPV